MTKVRLAAAVAAMALIALPAWAQVANRAWVSGHGADQGGCGAPTSPCRSLQFAHDHIVAAGGEIDVLDPAGYGAITITKAISIVNDGVGTAGVQQTGSGQDAISINAGPTDAITLRGLTIDGLGAAKDGVGLAEAGQLTMVNCVIRRFAHDGVYLQQATGVLRLSVLNSIATDNTGDGFGVAPANGGQILGVIDHSAAITNGQNGVLVSGLATASSDNAWITIANSDISSNVGDGIHAEGKSMNAIAFAREDISDFNHVGYYIDVGAEMYLSRTEALNNAASAVFIDDVDGALAFSSGDNAFAGFVHGALTPNANQ